jgi:hypothetical protein
MSLAGRSQRSHHRFLGIAAIGLCGGLKIDRHLVSEGAHRARQRLHDHAGIAWGRHRYRANRLGAGSHRLAESVRSSYRRDACNDTTPNSSATSGKQLTLRPIFSDPRFLRIAPLSATCIGSSWALQSLWAASWLADVEGSDRQSVIDQLFTMAIGISLGAFLLGTTADRLRKRGIATEVLKRIVLSKVDNRLQISRLPRRGSTIGRSARRPAILI